MKTYPSNEDFLLDIAEIANRLHDCGQDEAAREIREGLTLLNGLTDGWALLMEAVARALSEHGRKLDAADVEELQELHATLRKMVCRW